MNKKELITLIRNLAFHFGEQVSCEWISPDGSEWIEWKNAEISVHFFMELEKGHIRNIQMPQNSVTIEAELIATFENFHEWVNKASSNIGCYRSSEIVCIDQSNKMLLSRKDFSFARDNGLFPIHVYRMKRNTDR